MLLTLENDTVQKIKQAKGLNVQQKKLDTQIIRTNNAKVAVIQLSTGAVDKKA